MIGITLGEYFGIGFELLAKSLPLISGKKIKIYGDKQAFLQTCEDLSLPSDNSFEWHAISCQAKDTKDQKARAQYVIQQLNQATEDAMSGKTTGLLTCPIDKNIVRQVIPDFDGHTGYLQKQTKSEYSIMLMKNNDFNIVVGTQHIPLKDVPHVFTQKYFENLIVHTVHCFETLFGKAKPRIAVLGMNPHAGEIDENAEEKKWMETSIQNLNQNGFFVHGPFPADSFFPQARGKGWDVIISPYHDQALIAAKYNGLAQVVNITLGLPFLRTSPGHGVAYDILGKGIADPSSFQNALRVVEEKTL